MSLARTVSNKTIDFLAPAALRAMHEMIELCTLKKSFFGSVWPDPIGFLRVLHLKVYLIGSCSLTPLSNCLPVCVWMMKRKITEYKRTCLKWKLHPSQKKTKTSCGLTSTHGMIGHNKASWQCVMLYVQGQHSPQTEATRHKVTGRTHYRSALRPAYLYPFFFFPFYCIPIACSTRNVGFLQHGCQSC